MDQYVLKLSVGFTHFRVVEKEDSFQEWVKEHSDVYVNYHHES